MTPEKLETINGYAVLQFTADEIALIMDDAEVTDALLGKQKRVKAANDAVRTMRAGWLRGEADCRFAVKRDADEGSQAAQKIMLDIIWQRKEKDCGDE